MVTKLKSNSYSYHHFLLKRLFDLTISFLGLFVFSPLILIIAIAIKAGSKGPPFFIQKRVGKNGRIFVFIKFRTMELGADKLQKQLMHLNGSDGPVFKIYNDPRFTKFGKILARTGLDELPQLINVIKGEMSLVGPRPLPVNEAKMLTKSQKARELVKPGMTSSWVVSGAHNLTFDEWMRLDLEYIENGSLLTDMKVLSKTAMLVLKSIVNQLRKAVSRDS